MSPAAGGAAPTQPAASAAALPPPVIAVPEADRTAPPPTQENLRDPVAQVEGADPGNAAARKTAWNVPPPPPPAATGGILGGDESWPALADSAARAWPKSASSDSLKSLSDGSAPSLPEELIVPVVPSQPVSNPISTNPNAASTSPPPNATAMASPRQSGRGNQPNLVRHSGGNGGNNGAGRGDNGSSRGRSTGNNTSDLNSGSGGDGGLGGSSNLNSSVLSGGSNLNSSFRSGGINGSGIDSSRRMLGNNNWNGNGRGGGGGTSNNNNGTGIGDGGNRNNGSSPWNSNARNGGGISNGFGSRGGRNRRDHERGGSFPHRNYSRALPVPPQQQQPGYQPGPFPRPPPPPSAAHFMVSQPFMPYVPPFAYPADMQGYPFYITSVEQQFQNMHLVRQPMQPLGVQQDQLSLQHDIRQQIEHYFSTNNLCHDTYLRRHMDDEGWVPITLIAGFPMLTRFTVLGIDTNYILDSIRGSEMLEVQGNNVRRRNDWADWLLHLPPANQLQ